MKAYSPNDRRVRLSVVLFAALAVASCGSSAKVGSLTADTKPGTPSTIATSETISTPETISTSNTVGQPRDVPKILQVTAPLVGGSELDAASFAGKPVAFWFWAPT